MMETDGKPLKIKFVNPNSQLLTEEEKRQATIKRLCKIVSDKISDDCSKPINPELRCQILQHLHGFFPSIHTPNHPPYSLMIQKAISDLDEEDGSSEEAISGFISREYENLAWTHCRMLSIHLEKLCCNGEIIRTKEGHYVSACRGDGGDLGKMEQNMNVMQIENNENMIKSKGKQKQSDVSESEGKLEMSKKSKSGGKGSKRRLS